MRTLALPLALVIVSVATPLAQRAGGAPPRPATIGPSQTAPAGIGAISGVVTDGSTGRPLSGVIVSLSPQGAQGRDAAGRFTDTKGRFVFTDLKTPALYSISANRPGYFTEYSTGTIALGPDEWFARAAVNLRRFSAISGTVTDERGEPMVGIYVRALARLRVAGADRLLAGPVTTTDDRGVYRFGTLASGAYIVMVPSVQASTADGGDVVLPGTNAPLVEHYPVPPPRPSGAAMMYPITFSGSATEFDRAAVVDLPAGSDRHGVNIQMRPITTVAVSGVVEGPVEARTGLVLRILPVGLEGAGIGAEASTARVRDDGSFVFRNVPPGSYVIDAPLGSNSLGLPPRESDTFYGVKLPVPPGLGGSTIGTGGAIGVSLTVVSNRSRTQQSAYWARARVVVGGSDLVVSPLVLRSSIRISGKILTDLDPARPAPTQLAPTIALEPADLDPFQGVPAVYTQDTTFVLTNVLPGPYVFQVQTTGFMIKSVVIDGRDYADRAFVVSGETPSVSDATVTLTNAAPTISGNVRGAMPNENAAVIAFPVERDQWTSFGLSPRRMRSGIVTTGGTFSLTVPAGDYFVVAVPRSQVGAWKQDGFFERVVARAARVSVGWTRQATTDLALIDVR